jgi:mevalonate kinase
MKITGAGGGGYLVAIAEKPLQNALKVRGIL